jgi:FkbM family methyltransferase
VTGLHDDHDAEVAAGVLETLLSDPIEQVRERERHTFERAANGRDRLVLFGAGGLGQRTLAGLRAEGISPVAFSDNRSELWGTSVSGLPVLSPSDAAKAYGQQAVFVVTIWGAGSPHRFRHSVLQLTELGCDTIVPPAWLFWRYPEHLLPFYALDLPSKAVEQSADIRRCFSLLADSASQVEFVRQVQWRLSGDPGCLAPPVSEQQYLVSDVATPRTDDIVLDCGAFDGDTLRAWLEVRGATFDSYYALEPDPVSRGRLERSLEDLDPEIARRVRVLPFGVAGFTGPTTFAASGSLSSAIGTGDGITVDCVKIDDLGAQLDGRDPTFLKMDVEGAELDALTAGSALVKRAHPLLALAIYHRQDHLWKLPLKVKELWSGYQLYLRPHNEEGWDLILYSVPADRALTTVGA